MEKDEDYPPGNNLKYGAPCTNCTILDYKYYTTCHDNDKKVPLWSIYESKPEDLKNCKNRPDAVFIPEPSLPEGQKATNEDYSAVKSCKKDTNPCPKESNEAKYERAHMTPSNALCKLIKMEKTFVLSNTVPQYWKFNRTSWRNLESKIDKFARKHAIWVYTGPVFRNNTPLELIGVNKVWVPTDIYKIVIYEDKGQLRAFAFMGKNEEPAKNYKLRDFVTTIDEIEAITGLDFLKLSPEQPVDNEAAIESTPASKNELMELGI